MSKLNNDNKILSALGLCKKSGNLSLGFDSCMEAVKQKKSKLILITRDLSENTKQKLYAQVEASLIYLTDFSMSDVSLILKKSCGIISVNNDGFAAKIKSLLSL